MLFVYLIEENPTYVERMRQLLDGMERKGHTLCTSAFTLGEALTGCYKAGDMAAVEAIRKALKPPAVELLPFTARAAERFAQIRGVQNVSRADAIHLATAADAGVQLFLTNDKSVARMSVEGIDFIAGLDVNLY
jgi:predicted nucleic acid-binding protein